MDKIVSSEKDEFGLETRIFVNDDGDLTVKRTQDVEPIIEANKAALATGDGYTKSRDMRKVASIPMAVVEKWLREEGLDVFNPDHWSAIRRKLNSSDYLYLRTSVGIIK